MEGAADVIWRCSFSDVEAKDAIGRAHAQADIDISSIKAAAKQYKGIQARQNSDQEITSVKAGWFVFVLKVKELLKFVRSHQSGRSIFILTSGQRLVVITNTHDLTATPRISSFLPLIPLYSDSRTYNAVVVILWVFNRTEQYASGRNK